MNTYKLSVLAQFYFMFKLKIFVTIQFYLTMSYTIPKFLVTLFQ